MARTISYMQAINEALAQEMERDETVVVFGEDNVGGAGSPERWTPGAVSWASPRGSTARYPDRILDTPISESAFIGAAAGAACSGFVLWRSSCSSTSSASVWIRSTTRPRSFVVWR